MIELLTQDRLENLCQGFNGMSKISLYEIRKTFKRADLLKSYHMFKWKITRKRPSMQFDSQHPCIFGISTGRVGSETIAQLLKMAKNVVAYHEPWPELMALSKKAYELSNIYPNDPRLTDVLKEGFLTSRREFLYNALYCDRGYVESGPPATFLAPLILQTLPEAKFIHLVRDPRKVVTSGMRKGWYDKDPYDADRIVPDPDSEMGKLWNQWNPFQKNCWLWTETNDWILRFSQTLPSGKYLLVHSEDIFSANEEVIRQLFEYVGYPMPSSWKISFVLRQKLNAERHGVFHQPDDWVSELDEPLKSFMLQTAEKLGYEFVRKMK